MKRGFKCKKELLKSLTEKYDKSVETDYNSDFVVALQNFESITENNLRIVMDQYYNSERSKDQAWKTCKGTLYEYAVFKAVEKIIMDDETLRERVEVLMGDEALIEHRDQVVIKNWSEILPDVDIIIVEKATNLVKAIVSCKTSLRERLTETAFWKRELERRDNTKNIKLIFVTTDKDNELKIDSNRYILLHVVDCTFVTDLDNYKRLIETYKRKYGDREDFDSLMRRVKPITKLDEFLHDLVKGKK